MDHDQATQIQAAEKYLLGELPSSDREEFEEHAFTCFECAEDIKTGAIFSQNAREVYRDEHRPSQASQAVAANSGTGWFSWLTQSWLQPAFAGSLAACALLVGVVGYQSLVAIPDLERPHSTPAFALTVARGDETREIPNGVQFFEVNFDLPEAGTGKLDSYEMDVEGTAGRKLYAGLPVYTPPPPQTLVSLHCATRDFPPGKYILVLYRYPDGDRKQARQEVKRYSLKLK